MSYLQSRAATAGQLDDPKTPQVPDNHRSHTCNHHKLDPITKPDGNAPMSRRNMTPKCERTTWHLHLVSAACEPLQDMMHTEACSDACYTPDKLCWPCVLSATWCHGTVLQPPETHCDGCNPHKLQLYHLSHKATAVSTNVAKQQTL